MRTLQQIAEWLRNHADMPADECQQAARLVEAAERLRETTEFYLKGGTAVEVLNALAAIDAIEAEK